MLAVLGVLAVVFVTALVATRDGELLVDAPRTAPTPRCPRTGRWRPTTWATCGSGWRCGATGWRRSTRCSTGSARSCASATPCSHVLQGRGLQGRGPAAPAAGTLEEPPQAA